MEPVLVGKPGRSDHFEDLTLEKNIILNGI
jgi:hypothetical protein